jgi:hypothetical protein
MVVMDFPIALAIKQYFDDREMRQEAKARIAALHRSRQLYQKKVDEQVAKIRSMQIIGGSQAPRRSSLATSTAGSTHVARGQTSGATSQSGTVRSDDATGHAGSRRTLLLPEPASIAGRSR